MPADGSLAAIGWRSVLRAGQLLERRVIAEQVEVRFGMKAVTVVSPTEALGQRLSIELHRPLAVTEDGGEPGPLEGVTAVQVRTFPRSQPAVDAGDLPAIALVRGDAAEVGLVS